ncbi:nucleotidyltransferase family protein [Melaminivora suipulveris]|uniref:Nucleotidyltransferase family protein n=1 Tax=Melaminivora suipulveris TaxID=2109913 RepID=A0A2R3QFA8_9BURK|nr:nucleotidyltransferase family protein [Melaminivora suipulveris]AVO50449.1 nucleotidyltransferase family protein [Melaminivora suipulveris]
MSRPDAPAAPPACAAVLLAAGAGRRMGHLPKSLLRRDGETLLARQVRLLAAAGAAHIAVVLGHHADSLLPELQRLDAGATRLSWAVNPEPDAGPGSSLRCGLALLPDAATVLVALADQPLLELGDMQAVLHAWQQRGAGTELLVPTHGGQPGHPIAFGPQLRAAVMAMADGQGVREWRRAHPQQVQHLPAAHARYCTDVDTPQNLERLQRECGVTLACPPGFSLSLWERAG